MAVEKTIGSSSLVELVDRMIHCEGIVQHRKMFQRLAAAASIAGLICLPWDASAESKDATNASRVIAEWNLVLGEMPVADMVCDNKTLLVVDYLLSNVDGAYLGVTTMTVLGKDSKTIVTGTVDLQNEIAIPQLLAYGKNHAFFMTSVGGKYCLTSCKLAKKGFEKVGQLQFDTQISAELLGGDLIISTSSVPDAENKQTLTVQIYDLKLSKKLKEFSANGYYLSIAPVGVQKAQTWEVTNMTADSQGAISGINIKLMK